MGGVLVAAASLVLQASPARAGEAGHVIIGDALPTLTVPRLDGQPFALAELRGRVAVVAFYSPVCEPCHRMLPELVLVVISLDGVPSGETVASTGPGVIWLVDKTGEVDERFDPRVRPCTYLVDRAGVVRHINRGYGDAYGARVARWLRDLVNERPPVAAGAD
jgi:cytochrome c biogenesis protein CcmG/thiol:disulfide interchange protein DsbE